MRLAVGLLTALFVSTLVHFTDNFVRLDAYSPGDSGAWTKPLIVATWLVLTGVGAVGLALLHKGDALRPGLCFLVYAFAGLISPLHYATVPFSSYDAFQHAFIATDFLTGMGVGALGVILVVEGRASRRNVAD